MKRLLHKESYLADDPLAMAIHLAVGLRRPLLLEGEPGVGKTAVARALAGMLNIELIRLQCYEGLDANQALYEWDYTRQLLYIRSLGEDRSDDDIDRLFSPRFLLERPLLAALRAGAHSILLIDEIDRSDVQFEAFLLEFLSEFQVTVPEIGTIRAAQPPLVILTSNRTRELHDALRRRCLYHWIGFPDAALELEILRMHAPALSPNVAAALVEVVGRVRALHLDKPPGVAETIDWAKALVYLDGSSTSVNHDSMTASLGTLVKGREDLQYLLASIDGILAGLT